MLSGREAMENMRKEYFSDETNFSGGIDRVGHRRDEF